MIGGEATGSTEATTSVFIECALFDPVRVALTGRRHAITSDARQRFERGIDPALLPPAMEAATRLIQELCGGEASEVVSAGSEPAWQRSATLRFARLESLGGVAVPAEEAVQSLTRLGFTVQDQTAERVTVAVPSWRNDIAAPIQLDQAASLPPERARQAAEGCAVEEPEADLVEEVLRLRGLDTIPPVSLPRAAPVPPATLTPRQARAAVARRVLAADGLLECVTFSFMASGQAALFGGEARRTCGCRTRSPPTWTRCAPPRSPRWPWPRRATRRAGCRTRCCSRSDRLSSVGPDGAGQQVVAAGLLAGHTKRHPLAPSRGYGAMDAKAAALDVLLALGLPMESLSVTTDAPPGIIRAAPAWSAKGRSWCWRRLASCTPRCWPRST